VGGVRNCPKPFPVSGRNKNVRNSTNNQKKTSWGWGENKKKGKKSGLQKKLDQEGEFKRKVGQWGFGGKKIRRDTEGKGKNEKTFDQLGEHGEISKNTKLMRTRTKQRDTLSRLGGTRDELGLERKEDSIDRKLHWWGERSQIKGGGG